MAKRTFKLISLLLVLAFALTGCSMVEGRIGKWMMRRLS